MASHKKSEKIKSTTHRLIICTSLTKKCVYIFWFIQNNIPYFHDNFIIFVFFFTDLTTFFAFHHQQMLAIKGDIGNKDSCTIFVGLQYCSFKKDKHIKD